MSSIRKVRNNGKTFVFYFVLLAMVVLFVGLLGINMVGAEGNGGGQCHGTYLVDLEESTAIWTFAKDGTFQGTDSLENQYKYDHQQGVWEHTGAGEAKATWLDFSHNPIYPPTTISRIDAVFAFDDKCESLAGTLDFSLYFGYPAQDPLAPNPSNFITEVEYSGRRVNP